MNVTRSLNLLSKNKKANPIVGTTIVSSRMLNQIAINYDATYYETLTGFKWLMNSNQLNSLPQSLCKLPNNCDIKISYNCLEKEYHYQCIDDAGHHLGYWCK